MGGHIGVALFQAEFSVANGFAHGLGAVSEDKGFSEVLVSIVCHKCLLFLCSAILAIRRKAKTLRCVDCTMEAEWGMNFTVV
jgi:hypothetical protein